MSLQENNCKVDRRSGSRAARKAPSERATQLETHITYYAGGRASEMRQQRVLLQIQFFDSALAHYTNYFGEMQLRSDNSITRARRPAHNAIEARRAKLAHTQSAVAAAAGPGGVGGPWPRRPARFSFHHRSCAQSSRISSQARSTMHSLTRLLYYIFSPSLWSWPRQLECTN